MATIYNRNTSLGYAQAYPDANNRTTATLQNVVEDIERYWDGNPEKYFVITSTELFEKIEESRANPQRAALRIRNINADDKTTVSAQWLSYTGASGNELTNDDDYFILDFDLDIIRERFANNPYNGISGRIARNINGYAYVFFQYTQIILVSGGVGGDNASAGALIPPHP